jgi:hypothetical protein
MPTTGDRVREDLRLIGQEVMRAASEKFTGKLNITLHMKRGGIGQITVLMQKNLKAKPDNRTKKDT